MLCRHVSIPAGGPSTQYGLTKQSPRWSRQRPGGQHTEPTQELLHKLEEFKWKPKGMYVSGVVLNGFDKAKIEAEDKSTSSSSSQWKKLSPTVTSSRATEAARYLPKGFILPPSFPGKRETIKKRLNSAEEIYCSRSNFCLCSHEKVKLCEEKIKKTVSRGRDSLAKFFQCPRCV